MAVLFVFVSVSVSGRVFYCLSSRETGICWSSKKENYWNPQNNMSKLKLYVMKQDAEARLYMTNNATNIKTSLKWRCLSKHKSEEIY